MAKFIVVTYDGQKTRINVHHIVKYNKADSSGSDIVLLTLEELTVAETPKQIDELIMNAEIE